MTTVRKRIPFHIDLESDQAEICITTGQAVFRELISLPLDYGGELMVNFDRDQRLLSIQLTGARNLLDGRLLADGAERGDDE